jgi:hypothetical protein
MQAFNFYSLTERAKKAAFARYAPEKQDDYHSFLARVSYGSWLFTEHGERIA